jgi:hypothetical protein
MMQLVVGATTLELDELLSKRGNPYWGLSEDDRSGGRRYASRGLRVLSQGEQLPTLVFLAGAPLRLAEDEERPSRFVDGAEIIVDGRQLLASVRVTVRRDGDWNVTAAARLGPQEFSQRQTVNLPLTGDELEQARQAARDAGASLDTWLAELVRDAISMRRT